MLQRVVGKRQKLKGVRWLNLDAWIEKNAPNLKPPVANKLIYNGDLKVMAVGGPNERRDYHVQTGEEFFIQLKGELTLKVIERNTFKDIAVRAGESFVLPSLIPHSPQRSPGSVGLVFERSHTPDEQDAMFWFRDDIHLKSGTIVDWQNVEYQEFFHCTDLGTQLKPIIERYHAFKKEGERSRLHLSFETPTRPDGQRQCAPVSSFDTRISSLSTSTLLHRGDEILCNLHLGPATLSSPAAPFDIFVWQKSGNSNFRINGQDSDSPSSLAVPGDIHLISKGSSYDWHLESEDDALLTISNVYT